MKKTTSLILLLLGIASGSMEAQCINTNESFPPIASVSNTGLVETVSTSTNTSGYLKVENLIAGADYILTCSLMNGVTHKFITVTDLANNVIAFGPSPLTVEDIPSTTLRLHYTDNETCGSSFINHLATVQIVIPCPVPLNLQTIATTQTTAAFTWEPVGTETAWEVLVLEENAPFPTSSNSGEVMNNTPEYAIANLDAGTTYSFYIRANCGDGFSPWNGPLDFVTQCNPTDNFANSFDTTPDNELPVCWSSVLTGDGIAQYAEVKVVAFNANSGTKSVMLNNDNSAAGSTIMLVAPLLENLSAGTHRLKFFADGPLDGSIEVGTLDNTGEDGIFNLFEEVSITDEYQEYTIDFSSYSGSETFIAIRHNIEAPYNSIFLDDIRWEAIPVCPDVQEIAIENITAGSVALNWAEGGNETEWEIVYGLDSVTNPDGLTPLTPSITNGPEALVSGLEAATDYKIWVRSVCGDDNGYWIGPVKFKTLCLPTEVLYDGFEDSTDSNLPDCWMILLDDVAVEGNAYVGTSSFNFFTGEKAAMLNNGNSGNTGSVLLVAPQLSNLPDATHRVKFHAIASNAASITVGTLATPSDPESFVPFTTLAVTEAYQEFVVDFTTYDGTDTFLVFQHATATNQTTIYLDDIVWEVTPSCEDVTDVTLTEVTPDSFEINWETNGGETQWETVYGDTTVLNPNSLTPLAPVTSPTALIDDLEQNTTYKVWVRSICGENKGAWIGPKYITTSCLAVNNFQENAENTTNEDLPSCWSGITSGAGISQWAIVRSVTWNAFSGNRAIQLYNDTPSEETNVILVSPNLGSLANGTTHQLTFYADSNQGGILQVGTLNGNSDEATFTNYEEINITAEYAAYTVDFSGYDGPDTYIGIRHVISENGSIFLDEIKWEGDVECEVLTAFSENFDASPLNEVPSCWSTIIRGETVSPIDAIGVKQVTMESAPNALNFFKGFSGNSTTDELILVSPELSNLSAGTHQLSFSMAGNAATLEIGTLDSSTEDATFTVFDSVSILEGSGTNQFTIDFSDYSGTDAYIGMRLNVGTTQFVSTFVDNVVWSPLLAVGNNDIKDQFTYYPNPVKDVVNLSYDQNIGSVAVFNLLGQRVVEKSVNATATQIDMSHLAAGSYLIKVTAEDQTKTFKVIKQ